MSSSRLLPVLFAALMLSACLTPTEGTGRYGEARVQPEFAAGDTPEQRGIQVDSIRTLMRRGTETVVDARMVYEHDAAQAWMLELHDPADSIEVTMELMVDGDVAYRGARTINVVEGTAGRAPVEDVPVSAIDIDFAASVRVLPDYVVFSALGATRQLTAQVYDEDGNLLDEEVDWSSLNGDVAMVDDQGVVTALGQGTALIVVAASGLSDTATIVVDTTMARHATITADSASIAADVSASTLITVRLFDENGVATGTSGGTVTLATTLGTLGPVTDHADGTYTATLHADVIPGVAVITGALDGRPIADSALVAFRSRTSPGVRTTIDADSAALDANGSSRTLVTVRVLDGSGNPVGASAGVVKLNATLGTLSGVTDRADGTYTATFVAGPMAGRAEITGTLNGQPIADSAFVILRNLGAHPGTTVLLADSTAIDADGKASTLVTVIVFDANNNPVSGSAGTVVLFTTLGSLGPVTDHKNGRFTAVLTAGTTPGTAVVTGTINGQLIGDTAFVALRPTVADPGTTTIIADSAAINRGGVANTLVTVTVRDGNGNPVGHSAGVVTLTTTAGTLSVVTDHGDGTYTAILTSSLDAAVATITGTLNGVAITSTATVVFRQART